MLPRVYLVGCALLAVVGTVSAQTLDPNIPRAWDDKEVEGLEVALAARDRSPRYPNAAEYYSLKVRKIYRSYPVYIEGKEPPGYIESLKQREPEIIFDASKLRTKQDWIQAGKVVFEAEISFRPASPQPGGTPVPPGFSLPASPTGVLPGFIPGYSYIVRKKGELEVGINSCAGCHTRAMPDGSLLEGAQGNLNLIGRHPGSRKPPTSGPAVQQMKDNQWVLFGAPWVTKKEDFEASITAEELIRCREAASQSGFVFARQGTSLTHPPRIPSLIGVEDIRYLDATGLQHHRSIGDLMRYAIINEGLDTLAHFGDFQPSPHQTGASGEEGTRFSDEQLYALALYIYSLKPPPNPNSMDGSARRDQHIFEQQGCNECHTPPLYTNNKLTPAMGFKVPEDLRKTVDILDVSVGTDPTLALETRRATGFYKVPSLRGVWYRNGFGHNGQASTLEEWFDPARLRDGYVPKGFHLGAGPIKGHEFGLGLTSGDRQDLIAFLKTL
ncbi:MAG TPA: di-heme oxidoredictase family protein [Bryobacteraceae bacterium]|nr:di-heme oxidoredictase family protein [Bryobacteraceae bacterium]